MKILDIAYIPKKEFQRVSDANIEKYEKLYLISEMCRLNTFSSVKQADSGHLGSSLSALDIVTFLYFSEMNITPTQLDNPNRDIFFSSKGHDSPGYYSVLAAAGIIDFDMLQKLRRLNGLDGHPDVKIPGVEANSGSLGMGISKAKGMAYAKKLGGHKGRVIVMTGDGELQEGQIWESLQTTSHQKINNVHVIVDFNKIQTDKPVSEIIDLGDLEEKFRVFGWHVERCNGHSFSELDHVFKKFKEITDRPKVLIADTIKGKGISFMEGEQILQGKNELYRWHSGAPDDESYELGHAEIQSRIEKLFDKHGLHQLCLEIKDTREKNRKRFKDTAEKVVKAYEGTLVELGKKRKDIVVLDADLSDDCGLRPFEAAFPERFIENGIAEQDMVSMAGGLALQGYLPIVNSFGVFLASRANEQIYTNSTEGTKIVYVCHYAGLIPAGPGKSHQSLRDISLFGALNDIVALEPCNAMEAKRAIEWCVNEAKGSCLLRLVISPSPSVITFPDCYDFNIGKGTILADGDDAVIFGYGPVLLKEMLSAYEILKKKNVLVKVVNMPWLNRVDLKWLDQVIGDCRTIFVLDNHSPTGGLGDSLLNAIIRSGNFKNKKFYKLAVEGNPACGAPQEVLSYHGLDKNSLAKRILEVHYKRS